ncbi:MAG: TIGR02206 family membrane protein [Cyanobacteria bacterium P01_A01_bin.123]
MEISTSLHTKTLILVAIFVALNLYLGKKFEVIRQGKSQYNIFLGAFTLLFWTTYNLHYFNLENFDWSVSLPLHICDLLGFVSGMALIFSTETYRALLYFWGLSFSTQAFLYPIGDQDPSHAHYWLFWGIHTLIFTCTTYDLYIKKYCPSLDGLKISIKYGLLYILVILPVNITFGWNYGYIGNQNPEIQTIITFLGPWPYRVIVMALIAIFFQILLLLPWEIKSKV